MEEAFRPIRYVKLLCIPTVIIIITTKIIFKIIKRKELLKILEDKHKEIANHRLKLTKELETNPEIDEELTENDFSSIVRKLETNEITPLQLLRAHQKQALALETYGCIAEPIENSSHFAIKTGKRKNKDNKGKLWGIPVSLKESLAVKNHDITLGLVSRIGCLADKDCLIVELLRNAGAIPFITTSMAPGGCCSDSSNLIFGKQCNPFNITRSSGASSGGEAILLAKHGSVVGFGTDSAGSLRIPAAFCGLCSLKPTFERLTTRGIISVFKASATYLETCVGPMAREVDALVSVMDALCSNEMFIKDPTVVPMPFNREMYAGSTKKNLTIGFFMKFPGNLVVQPVPSIVRAVEQAVHILQTNGHTLELITAPEPDSFFELSIKTLIADGGQELLQVFNDEPVPKPLRLFLYFCWLPQFMKCICNFVLRWIFGNSVAMCFQGLLGCNNTLDALSTITSRKTFRDEYIDTWNCRDTHYDAIICPVAAYPALPVQDVSIYVNSSVAYTLLFNITNLPAGVVTTGTVTSEDVGMAIRNMRIFKDSKDNMNRIANKMQKGTIGLPTAVQVVGLPFTEEIVLRIMKEIETGVRENKI